MKLYRSYNTKGAVIEEGKVCVNYIDYYADGKQKDEGKEEILLEEYAHKVQRYELVSRKSGKSMGIYIDTNSSNGARVIARVKYSNLNSKDVEIQLKRVELVLG